MTRAKARVLGIAPYEGMKLAMERAAGAYPRHLRDVPTRGTWRRGPTSFGTRRRGPTTALSPGAAPPS